MTQSGSIFFAGFIFGVGFGFDFGSGFGVGFSSGLGVGFGFSLGLGFGVVFGLCFGFGVGAVAGLGRGAGACPASGGSGAASAATWRAGLPDTSTGGVPGGCAVASSGPLFRPESHNPTAPSNTTMPTTRATLPVVCP